MQSTLLDKMKKALAACLGSYVCLAFVGMLLFDVGSRFTFDHWPLDKFNSPNRSWVWWAAKDFHDHSARPDVVLLGSSLMMAALHGGDATYLNTPQNVAYHHRAEYLEKLLSEKLHQPLSTFAFAIGGQMVSDAYVISSTLLSGPQKPQTIVYGIAPRDFMDNMLTSPASTETFRLMNRLGDLSSVAMPARTTFWERVEYALAQVSFLYDHRIDFVYLQNKYARDILARVGINDLNFVHAPFVLRKIAAQQLAEDWGPNELMILPYNSKDAYEDNIPEYKLRYKAFKQKLFDMQFSFLTRLASHCQAQGINLVLVNMPLTTDNVALMPPGLYDMYMNSVKAEATKYGARFIDLNQPDVFTKQCFADSVHLNGHGGKKFFEVLADRLSTESRLALSGRRSSVK
jgi:hypothetical protein